LKKVKIELLITVALFYLHDNCTKQIKDIDINQLFEIDSESQQQIFIVDLSFNTDFTDELIVIYFNLEKQIFYVTHES